MLLACFYILHNVLGFDPQQRSVFWTILVSCWKFNSVTKQQSESALLETFP